MTNTKALDPFKSRGFGDSAMWLDFVNSELLDGFGNFTDMLDDSAWVRSFMEFWKFRWPVQDGPPMKEFKALRALLRRLVAKAAENGKLRIRDLGELNTWMKIPVIVCFVEDQNGLQLDTRPERSGWHEVTASIAISFAESLVEQTHDRLKFCDNLDCRWIFVDATKGNVRRWCSNATCGNRDRVRRARAARK
jgi:predicted RNA-binding Zn ribbon-like protein